MGGRKKYPFHCWVHQSPIVSGEKKWVLKFFLGGSLYRHFRARSFKLKWVFWRFERAVSEVGGLLQNSLCPELLFKFHHRKETLAPGSRGSSFERTTKGDFPTFFPISFKFFPLLFFFPGMTSAAVSTSWTA